ncbi:MAG: hypothetical protein ACRD5G_15815 [Candidatus Acidiferrales bacterium]
MASLLLCTFLTLALRASAQSGQAGGMDEERVLTVVKGTPARELDSALPKMRFERWLLDVAGEGAELQWELNDCGEQTGDPAVDSQRDLPVCAGVYGQLEGGRGFQILLVISTRKKGVGGKPQVHSIFVQTGRRIAELKRLRDLPKALESDRR